MTNAGKDVGGTKGVSRVQSVPDGSLLTFEIRSWPNDPSKERLDRGHYGPCAVYLKKVSSAVNDKATGDGWFKIFDHGYDASTKRWCTDEIIDNKGLLSVNVPKGLESGSYLARPEILALHNANTGDPQFYTGCAQIFLEGSGNLSPESTVSIPGYVKYGEPSTSFNIYNSDLSTYKVPGPAVAKLVAKSSGASTASSKQTEGLKPEGCIVENSNWCGKEVPSYSDEKGCWAASEDCWSQDKECWATTLPTGGKGCELWQKKCQGIQDQCNAKNFQGPPSFQGTPEKKAIDVGKIMATVGGGIVDTPSTPKTSEVKQPESKTQAPAKETPIPAKETPASAKQTPAAENNKPDVPAPAPAKSNSPIAAPAKPAPKPTPSPNEEYSAQPMPQKDNKPAQPIPQKEDNKPIAKPDTVSSITSAAVAPAAPKSTPGPACVPGGKCVTVTEVETLIQTVYVTASAGSYKRSFRPRGHVHRF